MSNPGGAESVRVLSRYVDRLTEHIETAEKMMADADESVEQYTYWNGVLFGLTIALSELEGLLRGDSDRPPTG